ncbi:MAG: tetratricopeptide repeat protein [Bryobacteraceae bacterium]|nr:tetratricopeptide repeat protein [Bryobacteraceae bacterium]
MTGLLWIVLLAQAPSLDEGRQAFVAGDLPRAEALFRAHLKANPGSAEAMSNLAAVLSRRERFPEAVTLYQRALNAAPQLVEINFNLAVAQIRAYQQGAAAESLRRYLKARPADLRAKQLLGVCLVETGEIETGIGELEAVAKAQANDPTLLLSLAYAHAKGGDEARGAELLKRIEAAYPAQAALVEGLLEFRRSRYAEAKVKFEEALRHDPNQAPALAAMGRVHLAANEDAEAISFFEKALARAPADAVSTYQLGVLYDRNGRTPEGRKLLERAAQLRAAYPDPYYQLGRISFRGKQYQQALGELQTAAKFLPNHESIRLLLGRTYQALGRKPEADREFALVRKLKANAIERSQKKFEGEP